MRTAIEITDKHLKVFKGRVSRGALTAESCAVHAIDRTDDSLEEILKDAVSRTSGSRGEYCAIVPRRLAILRQMHLPARDDREIMDMVGLRLLNNIPFPVEDVVYQYQVLDQDSNGYSRLLVSIIPKEEYQKYVHSFYKMGFENIKVTLSSYGLCAWWAHGRHRHKALVKRPAVLVDIDLAHSEICFCHEDKMYYSRSLPYGRKDLVTEGVDKLFAQIKLTLELYQRESLGPAPETVMILLPYREGIVLQERLSALSDIPVEVSGALDGMAYARPDVQEALEVQGRHSLTAAQGVLVSNANDLVNFVPQEVKKAKRQKIYRRRLIQLTGLFFIAAALSVCGKVIDIDKRAEYLAKLEGQDRQLQTQVNEAKAKMSLVEHFDQKFTNAVFLPALMEELRILTPEEISFRTLSLDEKGLVTIQGYAGKHAQINELQARLIRSSRFNSVDLKFATNRKIANRNLVDFKIVSRLDGGKGGE